MPRRVPQHAASLHFGRPRTGMRDDGGGRMIFVTHVHLEGGASHEHIESVKWRNPTDDTEGTSTRESMVEWINKGGDARVTASGSEVRVGVVKHQPRPYI